MFIVIIYSLSSEVRTLELSKYADENPLVGQDQDALAAAGLSSPSPSASRSAQGTGSASRSSAQHGSAQHVSGGAGGVGSRVYGRSPQSLEGAGPSSAEAALGKRKSPVEVRGAVATREVQAMAPPVGRRAAGGAGAGASAAVGPSRGRAAARDAIVEETEEDVEDSSA